MKEITGRGLSAPVLLIALLACKMLDKKNESGIPAASAAPAATATTSATAAAAGKQKTDLSGPKDAKGVALDKLLGTKADGWTLPPFSKLKEDQTPAEVGKLLPGGDKLDEYGFVEIKPTDMKGVAMYKLSYQDSDGKKGLSFISILFEPGLSDEPFWNALVDHLQKKLAVEMTDHGDHHVQWVGPGFLSWSLSKGITHEGYELQTAVGK